MSYHEKPALSLYRNIGKQGIFNETFLKPLNIRKPNLIESLDVEEITLKDMLEEAYVPPPPPTRELDIQAMFDRYRIEVKEEENSSYIKVPPIGFIIGGVGTAATSLNFIMGGFSAVIIAILILLWTSLIFLLQLN